MDVEVELSRTRLRQGFGEVDRHKHKGINLWI